MKASSKPKISVVMAVYNGMPYLKEAVKSILNQTYNNFEFIIIDDASTDSSWLYLKDLKDTRIKHIKNKKNLGLARSLNIGLKIAKGDYIARMDADDVSLPPRLETQLKFLENNPGIDICGTWVDKIDENGKTIGETKYPEEDSAIKKLLFWQPSIVHPTFMGKAKFFKDLNFYDPKFDYAEEYELLMRAKNKFKMANIPQKLLKWRFWNKRRSRTDWEKMEKVDYKIKLEAYKRGDLSNFYLPVLGAKFFISYIIPYNFKLSVFKLFKMI